MIKVFKIKEHRRFDGEDLAQLKKLPLDFEEPADVIFDTLPIIPEKYLGLSPFYRVSYFIGADWLIENQYAISVFPKLEGIDFMRMFMDCFKNPELIDVIGGIYKIKINRPSIKLDSNDFELTPLLIVHYLFVLKSLVKKGLKNDYILIEENLNSKFKGKLLFNQHISNNYFKNRIDRNYCRFQDYSTNCIENQLLKRALTFVNLYVKKFLPNEIELQQTYNTCWSAFLKVKEDIGSNEFRNFKINPLFKEYAEALKLAKMILKRFAYSINNISTQDECNVPPFYIDMALLFECYGYSKLKEVFSNKVIYQPSGKYGRADFIIKEEKLIIDTKYKEIYQENKYDIENIRQLSGYARDINILKKLNVDSNNPEVISCIFIYPNQSSKENFTNRDLKEEVVNQFAKFYKIGIKLPIKQYNSSN